MRSADYHKLASHKTKLPGIAEVSVVLPSEWAKFDLSSIHSCTLMYDRSNYDDIHSLLHSPYMVHRESSLAEDIFFNTASLSLDSIQVLGTVAITVDSTKEDSPS